MTKLIYLNDTYLSTLNATIINELNDANGLAIIVDRTIFYPQGGGQPSDVGFIKSESATYKVSSVRLNDSGLVLHYGEYIEGTFTMGQQINLSIDLDKRIVNARVHSAGHLLDCAVSSLDLAHLKPTKGFHFPEGPYVEYEGILDNKNDWINPIQEKINDLVKENIQISNYSLSFEEAAQKNIWAPAGKSARVVDFEGFDGCGCGGTHVLNSSEIGEISIRKIKVKKGVTRIAYALK